MQSCDGCSNGFKDSELVMPFPDGDQFCYCPTCLIKATDSGPIDCLQEEHTCPFFPHGIFLQTTNGYQCDHCKDLPHSIIELHQGWTNQYSRFGAGIPTTIRQCTNCRRYDGPWVSAEWVGDI